MLIHAYMPIHSYALHTIHSHNLPVDVHAVLLRQDLSLSPSNIFDLGIVGGVITTGRDDVPA